MEQNDRLLAEQIVSAQCSYDTAEHKQELIRAFIAGMTAQRNADKKCNAVVEPYEGGSAYTRGWRAALGEVFKELKLPDIVAVCPPNVLEHLLDLLNELIKEGKTEAEIIRIAKEHKKSKNKHIIGTAEHIKTALDLFEKGGEL